MTLHEYRSYMEYCEYALEKANQEGDEQAVQHYMNLRRHYTELYRMSEPREVRFAEIEPWLSEPTEAFVDEPELSEEDAYIERLGLS